MIPTTAGETVDASTEVPWHIVSLMEVRCWLHKYSGCIEVDKVHFIFPYTVCLFSPEDKLQFQWLISLPLYQLVPILKLILSFGCVCSYNSPIHLNVQSHLIPQLKLKKLQKRINMSELTVYGDLLGYLNWQKTKCTKKAESWENISRVFFAQESLEWPIFPSSVSLASPCILPSKSPIFLLDSILTIISPFASFFFPSLHSSLCHFVFTGLPPGGTTVWWRSWQKKTPQLTSIRENWNPRQSYIVR